MSIISIHSSDNSNSVAKEFASIVADYMDDNDNAAAQKSMVPLENLYRLLEMFRCDSYADEPRSGVLVLGDHEPKAALERKPGYWNDKITVALRGSLSEVYPGTPKDQALDQLQDCIRTVAKGLPLPQAQSQRAQVFFNRFCELV